MRLPLDRDSSIPLYKQIENHLRQNILSGTLAPETRLPATRQLAQDLGVSRITVKNAYAELESEGLLYTLEGSGTYVAPLGSLLAPDRGNEDTLWPLWQQELQVEDGTGEERFFAQTSPAAAASDLITFTGVGDPRQFPVNDFYKALQTVIRRDGVAALGYGEFNNGYPPLRQTIAHVLASQGIQAYPDDILITSGSQQALTLACQILLKPGDPILVESPTYNFALELFQALHLKVLGIPVDGHGMQVDMLESLLQQHHPKLIYTVPNFQNPTGACLSGTRRRRLLALAERYNVPILEDDFVGDLRYEGRAQPAIKGLDPGGRVIYTGTFSKMVMPGLRVGFLVADGPVFQRIVKSKRVSDLATSTLLQRTLDVYVTVGRYQAHLRRSCRVYRRRRDAMLAAIKEHLPPEVALHPPQGGLFIWLRLPEKLSSSDLLPLARQGGVEFAPGSWFFPNRTEGTPYLRLNFATQTVENIEKGIERLGKALEHLQSSRVSS